MSPTGQTPAQAVAKTQCNNSKKQPHSGEDNGPVQKSRRNTAQGQKKASIPVDSDPKMDDTDIPEHSSSSDDSGSILHVALLSEMSIFPIGQIQLKQLHPGH